jgi:hypothetical protein
MTATHRLASFFLASLLTLCVASGIDHLATSDTGAPATLAVAQAPRA